jgi:starch phosphorylase
MVLPTTIGRSAPEPTIDLAALEARLPTELRPLARLAFNYWWSWQSGGPDLFRALDPARWEACDENPVRLLEGITAASLQRAARDAALVARITAMESALARDLARPSATMGTATPAHPIAFVCAEYAVHASLPIYAGGLGVLAGDYIKEASDRAAPVVAIGLFYRRGYFHQRLDPSGWQHEAWSVETAERLPMTLATGASGAPIRIRVPILGRDVLAQIWRVDVGRVPLFLLDTDLPENGPVERWISAQLYVGDSDLRLMQYALLGIGGMRALRALGIDPAIVHLNEGHAALAILELLRAEAGGGAAFDAAVLAVRERVVFTTHTPVAAGNERFDRGQLDRIVDWTALGVDRDKAFELGRAIGKDAGFGMTELALRGSRSANGVSRRHGEVARSMWQPLFARGSVEETPIRHVTNGVHTATWMAQPMRDLLTRHLGDEWERDVADPARWAAVDAIPDEELWAVRSALRASLVGYVRARSVSDRLARGEPLDYVEGAAQSFDPNVLTLGFARRVASYKRLHLLVESSARALRLLTGSRPVQVIIAGKAHPRDDEAKRLVQRVFAFKRAPHASSRVAFLEDYDTRAASVLVAGCDVWLNLPRPPLEASGTSGMKAALNGGLNLSVLDGWWCEASDGANGWSIRSDVGPDDPVQDTRDADALYALLESEIVPSFYERDAKGIPRAWVRRMKASLRSIAPMFSTARMLTDYARNVYARGFLTP